MKCITCREATAAVNRKTTIHPSQFCQRLPVLRPEAAEVHRKQAARLIAETPAQPPDNVELIFDLARVRL